MIVCPNCNHQNPDGATQCEACYTPLPSTTACPNCGAPVQTDATFCGQCGFDLRAQQSSAAESAAAPTAISSPDFAPTVAVPDPLVTPDPLPVSVPMPGETSTPTPMPEPAAATPPPVTPVSPEPVAATPPSAPPIPIPAPAPTPVGGSPSKTQLQQETAKLIHVQTNTTIELPSGLAVIHIGKPNDRVPPDVDVAGFPNSDVVSRIHADIRVEGDGYYIEDTGSSNGTYINNFPLPSGNRHRLRPGDRIALGKNDLVTFLFQLS